MPELPRILGQAEDFIRNLQTEDPDLAKSILQWIIGPLDQGEVEALQIDGEHGPEYASFFPDTEIQVFWRVTERGRT